MLHNTAELLAQKNMLGKEKEIVMEFEKIWNKEKNIIIATINSREELSTKQTSELTKKLKEKYNANEVEIQNVVEKEILGGIKITVGDEVMDYSLGTQLHNLGRALVN